MGSGKTVYDMSLVGGHPALDFVNTVYCRRDSWGPDLLTCYGDVLGWAERTGQIERGIARRLAARARDAPAKADTALDRARRLREALYYLCMAEIGGFAPDPSYLRIFNDAVSRAQGKRALKAKGPGLRWDWISQDDLDRVADGVVLSAVEFLVDRAGDRRAVRECLGRNCGWLFLDTSRGGRRRWCSDKICGISERVRRSRATTQFEAC